LRAKLITALTRQIISYLYNDLPISSRELMMKGESESIEFKASAHPDHFPKIVKTVAAMINSQGGTILLGVEDHGAESAARIRRSGHCATVFTTLKSGFRKPMHWLIERVQNQAQP